MEEVAPQVVLTIGDPWMFDDMPAVRRAHPFSRWLACFPIDSVPIPDLWKAWMCSADGVMVFSRYAADAVRSQASVDAIILPHGVDTARFFPADPIVAKARVGVSDKFVVGTVAANQRRKNLPALFDAFARFARGKDDVVLYLHTPIVGELDLQPLIERFGITEITRATVHYDALHGLSDVGLATVYNSFDVFALPTMAEGFGLPILESQACGVPALATDCSSCSELLPHPLQRIRVRGTEMHANGMVRSLIDEADLADRLDLLYQDRATRDELARRSLRFATACQWKILLAPMIDLVASLSSTPFDRTVTSSRHDVL
ncbi:MAG TPA: glycosyltransferase [Tepidisphaeraceae bacterium]|nr:glycosyltransferase [Tepidisphaeraceae bacterium]